MTRLTPEAYGDDEAFLYANELVHDADRGEWTIRVDPDECLVGPATERDVDAVRSESPRRADRGAETRYRGRILLSAGTVLLIDDRVVLLRRGPDAPVDPGRWSSPAGRCDGPPGTTALREFYQELVVTYDGRPAFVTVDDRSDAFESTYEERLRRVGEHEPPDRWTRLPTVVPDGLDAHAERVVLAFGDRRFADEMVAFYDEESNTLECRFVRALDAEVTPADALAFRDGEFGRPVTAFDVATLRERADVDLVATDAFLVGEVLSEVVER